MNLDEAAASIPLKRLGDPRDIGYAPCSSPLPRPVTSPARPSSSTAGTGERARTTPGQPHPPTPKTRR